VDRRHIAHPFQVGSRYANRHGEYEVLGISVDRMRIRYVGSSEEQEVAVALQARIWENIRLGVGQNTPSTAALLDTQRRVTGRYGGEVPVVQTIPWEAYSDHALTLALQLRAELERTFPSRYKREKGSDSIKDAHGSTMVKVLPFDANIRAVAHLGSGALVGFRAERYEEELRQGTIPRSLQAESTRYRFGAGVYRDFYILPIHSEQVVRERMSHLIQFVARLIGL
jgi:hypothetical protein